MVRSRGCLPLSQLYDSVEYLRRCGSGVPVLAATMAKVGLQASWRVFEQRNPSPVESMNTVFHFGARWCAGGSPELASQMGCSALKRRAMERYALIRRIISLGMRDSLNSRET